MNGARWFTHVNEVYHGIAWRQSPGHEDANNQQPTATNCPTKLHSRPAKVAAPHRSPETVRWRRGLPACSTEAGEVREDRLAAAHLSPDGREAPLRGREYAGLQAVLTPRFAGIVAAVVPAAAAPAPGRCFGTALSTDTCALRAGASWLLSGGSRRERHGGKRDGEHAHLLSSNGRPTAYH